MITTSHNLAYFLQEMERQYPKTGPEAARLRRRIAGAAARGARRGRGRARSNVRLAVAVLVLVVLACLLAGNKAAAAALADLINLPL